LIIVDANLLIYAHNQGSSQYTAARAWLEKLLSGSEPVGLPWQTIGAFVRIITHPRLPGHPVSMATAVEIVDRLLDQPNVRALGPGEQHWPLFRQMLVEGRASGDLTTDAQLAAVTIESGGVLYTTDRDFARFPGLRWKNPLVPQNK
jgi:uncharacterized protein